MWVPCLGGSWSAETLLCGESCVGPYSGKTMLYRTPALRGPVYRTPDAWGPCCVGILL